MPYVVDYSSIDPEGNSLPEKDNEAGTAANELLPLPPGNYSEWKQQSFPGRCKLYILYFNKTMKFYRLKYLFLIFV